MATVEDRALDRRYAVEHNVVILDGETARPRQVTIQERMQSLGVPGIAVAVVHEGDLDWTGGYGLRDTGLGSPVETHTLFQAGSISKPVAALAALRLVDEGVLELDRDVNELLTSWHVPVDPSLADTPVSPVTLRGLLSHTAGLTVHGFPGYGRDEKQPTLIQVLNGEPPANTSPVVVDIPPGTKFRYSGGGYSVMQQLLVDVLHKPFPAIMDDLVLAPMGMKESTYRQPLPEEWHTAAATGYRSDGKAVEGGWHVYPEMAAAGLWSTPRDLVRFALALEEARTGKSGALLSQEIAREMFTPQVEGHIGLGIFFSGPEGSRRFGHDGADAGFQCSLIMYIGRGMGACVMTNSDTGSAVAADVLKTVARVYEWPDFIEERVVAPIDRTRFHACVGEYMSSGGNRAQVTLEGAALILHLQSLHMPLFPHSETHLFTPTLPGLIEVVRGDGDTVTTLIYREGEREVVLAREKAW